MKIFNTSHLKSKSGMTLLEAIIALALFAIINVGFYGMFSTVLINMYQTSEITESAFLSQQEIEVRIADVKSKLKEGLEDEVADEEMTITLFSGTNQRSVIAYHLTETMENGRLVETLVAQNRPPQLQVPVITSDVVIATYRSGAIDKYPNIASKDDLVINLVGGTPTVDDEGLLIQHLYYWYISRPGIYTQSQPPQFPDDYEILAGYTAKDIVTIPDSFAGRFLKLVVTPVGEKGAMGDSVESNGLFISPLTVYSNLLVHYDASWIDKNSTAEYLNDKVIRWYDISPARAAAAVPTSNTVAPTLDTKEYGADYTKRTFEIERSGAGGTQVITGSNSFTSKADVTVYFVANFATTNGVTNGVTLLHSRSSNTNNRNKFILKTSTNTGSEGQLELVRFNGSGTAASVVNQTNYRTDQWEIIKLEVYYNSLAIRHSVSLTNGTYAFVNNATSNITGSANINLTPFAMTFAAGYGIGEVMIYDGVVSAADEQKVLKYLTDKYNP